MLNFARDGAADIKRKLAEAIIMSITCHHNNNQDDAFLHNLIRKLKFKVDLHKTR